MKTKLRLGLIVGSCFFVSFTITSDAQTTQGATNFKASNTSQVVNAQQGGSGFGIKASTASTGGSAQFSDRPPGPAALTMECGAELSVPRELAYVVKAWHPPAVPPAL
ncbi:MAG: hypothetical protein JWO91_2685 [Acidobacteriaceae bacterium]|jgi:ABC-type phosphate transport system substrate-binding protein|nr:hypothetical protein [Acidobacteriaceae bacterium]